MKFWPGEKPRTAPGSHTGTIDIQHLGGNKQVVLANGQRWHLPRGMTLHDIPAEDRLGDAKLQVEFPQLKWSSRGVDAVDPRPGGLPYEVLSGTSENFAVHGRRMATGFFRMIYF
jgi:hypothetical protein